MEPVMLTPEEREVNRIMINIILMLKCSLENFLFTLAGLLSSVVDIGLDIYAAMSFCKEKNYVYLSILLLILVGSSILVNVYSWLFYRYDNFERKERFLSWRRLTQLHSIQLGIFFRWCELLCIAPGFSSFPDQEGIYLSHDLGFLRLIETFSESAPQLVLMLTIILQRGHMDTLTVLKAVWSALFIAISVTMYHRSLRWYMGSFQLDKKKLPVSSSVVYFLWNFLLISSRLTTLALITSIWPCSMFIHFLCSWLVLSFFAWRSKTDFMETPCGEWLYRATVGLIWYFNWLNMVEVSMRYKRLYDMVILGNIVSLCIVWCFKINTQPPYVEIPQLYDITIVVIVVSVYIIGLIIREVYYKYFHSNLKQYEGSPTEDEVNGNSTPQVITPMVEADRHYNERMRKLAEHFYIY